MDIIMKKIYKGWRSLHLFTRTLIGFGIGVTLGVILGPQASIFEFLGTILLRLINMVVAPLVLCLLISAAADINDYRTLGKINCGIYGNNNICCHCRYVFCAYF